MITINMNTIRQAAQRLGTARLESTTRATALEHELAAAAGPIYKRHREGLDTAAAEEAEAEVALMMLIKAAPQLFKNPRSITVDGVRAGYRKESDGIDFDDEAAVIARIRAFDDLSDLAGVLIRTEEHLNLAAIDQLDGNQRKQAGIRTVTGVDQPFITFTDTPVEKLVKLIIADAAQRQGDKEPAKKSKAKRKEVA